MYSLLMRPWAMLRAMFSNLPSLIALGLNLHLGVDLVLGTSSFVNSGGNATA